MEHVPRHLRPYRRVALLVGAAVACVLACSIASAQNSPLTSGDAAGGYADGSRLSARYDNNPAVPSIPGVLGARTEAAASAAIGKGFQPSLPAGFASRVVSTTQVMTPITRVASAAVPAAPPISAKYVSLLAVTFKGVPLSKGSDYLVITDAKGAVLTTRQRALPASVDATAARVSSAAAVTAARQHAGAGFSAADSIASQPRLEIWVDAQLHGHLAWALTLERKNPADPASRTYWIGANEAPTVLNWENNVYHTDFGTVTGTIWQTSPFGATGSLGLPNLTTTRSGSSGGTATTGADGRYAYSAGTGPAIISATLGGTFFVVKNQAGAGMVASNAGTPENPIDLNFGASVDTDFAQTSSFYWANFARQTAGILSPTELASLPINVNINSACNAYWNGSSINFFKAGSGCPNTAYADVVMHEYGHGIDSAKGGILDGGYSEGFGDSVAVLASRQPCVGRDFFGPGTCLRLASDVILWPPASGEEVHAVGRRYVGFVWQLVQELKKTYADDDAFALATRLVMAAAAANPSNIPDAVLLSFVADDTDGNLATCSPHFRELAAAADSRHIPRPADCVGGVGGVPATSAQFPWTPPQNQSANANLASATIVLDRPMEVHITANSSFRPTGAVPGQHSTGFFDESAVNVMWTDSLRNLTSTSQSDWTNFGSTFAIHLPAGTHTIFWKIWTTTPLQFSGGSMLVEAFPTGTVTTSAAAVGVAASPDPSRELSVDSSGNSITRLK